jgi:hypothetical protein
MTFIEQTQDNCKHFSRCPPHFFLGQAIVAGFSQEVMEELVGQTGDWKKSVCGLV